jgi:hypothetical protein
MFCPVCRAEYRPGFTHCRDCNVPLVAELPPEDSSEAYAVLWRSEDSALHDTLCEELESSAIEYADVPLELYLQESDDPFHLNLGPRFGFVISVKSRQSKPATAILARLLNEDRRRLKFPCGPKRQRRCPPQELLHLSAPM